MRNSKDLPVVISNLSKARNFISKEEHWGKGVFFEADVPCDWQACALGALYFIGVKIPDDNEEHENQPDELCYLNEALYSLYHHRYDSVIVFNDAEETTHAQVMQLFDVAIVHAERDLRFCNAAMSEPAEQIAFTSIEPASSFPKAKAKVVKILERLGVTVTEEIE